MKWSVAYRALDLAPRRLALSPRFASLITAMTRAAIAGSRLVITPRYLRAVEWAAGQVLPQRSLTRFIDAHIEFLADFHLRNFRLARDAAANLRDDIVVEAFPHLDQARERGHGVLMPVPHIGVPLQLIFSSLPGPKTAVLSHAIPLVREICARADHTWNFIALESRGIRGKLEAAFAQSHTVVIITDAYHERSQVELITVFGALAASANGAFKLAQAHNSPVVPLHMARTPSGTHFRTAAALSWNGLSTAQMMQAVQHAQEPHVLAHAEQWLGWAHLPRRWSEAYAAADRRGAA